MVFVGWMSFQNPSCQPTMSKCWKLVIDNNPENSSTKKQNIVSFQAELFYHEAKKSYYGTTID